MTTRLTLLCHAPTGAMRHGCFPRDDDAIAGSPSPPAGMLPVDRLSCGPSLAARGTAAAIGAARIDAALRDIDYGEWAGRGIAAVQADAPERLSAWLALDPDAAPGSESVAAVARRTAAWLDGIARGGGTTLAISHPIVLRAAIAGVLDVPMAATAAIDIGPLTAVRLTCYRRWRLAGIVPAMETAGAAGG